MKNILTIIILTICSYSFAQTNLNVTANYRKTPNGTAKENFTFDFNTNSGKLLMTDNDFGTTKEYLIKFKETMYDNGSLFNIVYQSDAVQNVLQNRSKSDNGLFAVFYDEKNGNILGVKVVLVSTGEVDVYLTEKGKSMMK
ncbi:MAG: hypothetical protein ABI549_13030 [Flavobacterium sp.]|uniref:hypothetical protein n=1 Tax=Flavobacterium sp. TaxID=239 RepID=UPI0032674CFD